MRVSPKLLILASFAISSYLGSFAGAQNSRLDEIQQSEYNNSHFSNIRTSIPSEYLPGSNICVPMPLFRGSSEELAIHASPNYQGELRQLITRNEGADWLTVVGHPLGIAAFEHLEHADAEVCGSPSSSVRSLRTTVEGIDLYVKTSIQSKQFGFSRIIPAWEVRRSVGITSLTLDIPQEEKDEYMAEFIPEPIGGFTLESSGPIALGVSNQPIVIEQGLIYRDPSIFDKYPDLQIVPMFYLLEDVTTSEPPIVTAWKKVKETRNIGFTEFLVKFLIEPFVRSTSYLVLHQGLIPDTHPQNVLVGIDSKTGEISRFLHRDLGSFKTNILLRMSKGLPNHHLLTRDTQFDFKPKWASEISWKPFFYYFYEYVFSYFRWNRGVLDKYVEIDDDIILEALQSSLEKEIKEHLGIDINIKENADVEGAIKSFIEKNVPKVASRLSDLEPDSIRNFINHQNEYGQVIESLPNSWAMVIPEGQEYVGLDAGVLYREAGSISLALYGEEKSPAIPHVPPSHYETYVDSRDIVLFEENDKISVKTSVSHPVPVIRLGSRDEPVYLLMNNLRYYEVEDALLRPNREIEVEVVLNISHLSHDRQREIISSTTGLDWDEVVGQKSCLGALKREAS